MITKEEAKKIAVLSRLQFNDDELEKIRAELDGIITYINKLNELNTDGVEINYSDTLSAEELREDIARPSMDREKLLSNAPDAEDGAFRVPTVVE